MGKQNNIPFRRQIRSFVKREGRLTTGQARALQETCPFYGLSLNHGMQNLLALFERNANTVLEIGFGNGSSLLAMAKQEPQLNFIGIEVHRPGVGALLMGIEREQVENIRIYQEDAVEVLEHCIPDNSLYRVQLYFPDPWHKKKHHKRRILQPEFIALIQRKLKFEGIFHLATDWQNYAEYMVLVMEASEGFTNLAGAEHFAEKPAYRPTTKFEQRGQKLGHRVFDLLYQRST